MTEFVMPFIWFCASGGSFFLGCGLMILGVAVSTRSASRLLSALAGAMLITGLALIVLAAMPLSPAFYAPIIAGVALVYLPTKRHRRFGIMRGIGQAVILFLCLTGIIRELSSRTTIAPLENRPLYVIGDSVSAGIGGPGEITWPQILADRYGIEVINLAKAGATVASASGQVRQIGNGAAFVLLEIGGNDLFAPTPPAQFRKDLATLLKEVVHPDRTVVMLGLPLFPWDARYGRVQRELARSFHVALVPKRFLVSILREKGTTLDLAHLSAQGHQKMANDVADLLGIAGKVPRQDGRQR